MLNLIGLGVSGDVSLSAYREIQKCQTVVCRTEKTHATDFLRENGIKYIAFDEEYDRARSFDGLNKRLFKRVLELLKGGDVCYLVDGSVTEDVSCGLLIKKVKNVKIFVGVGKAESALAAAKMVSTSFSSFSAYDIVAFKKYSFPIVVYDLDSALTASEWKIKLSEIIGEEEKVAFVSSSEAKKIPLYEIDRQKCYDGTTAIIVSELPIEKRTRFDFNDLMEIVTFLRSENGCPWDKVQTKESIRSALIEECYELVDAIDKNDDAKIEEEIGDVLLQAAFHSVLACERAAFDEKDVLSGICGKLIFRHSHIFGTDKAETADSVLGVWDKNKIKEKGYENVYDYVVDVPKCFPSLVRGEKTVKRAKPYFDKAEPREVSDKIKEIIGGEINADSLGKILLLLSYAAESKKIDLEEALYKSVSAFSDGLKNKSADGSLPLCDYVGKLK